MTRDVLAGGAFRLSAPSISFLFQRLKPGVLLTAARGIDRGELGSAPLDVVDREQRLFARPVHWYFDASLIESASVAVSDDWAGWFRSNAGVLARLHVLTGSQATHITVGIVRHFADAHDRIAMYRDRAEWMRSFKPPDAPDGDVPDLGSRFDEPAVTVQRIEDRKKILVRAAACEWSFEMPGGAVLLTRFRGDDSGDATDAALDEIHSVFNRVRGKIHWFLDLREARNVTAPVTRVWTDWLKANRQQFASIRAVSPSPLFPLVLTLATYQSGTENLVRIYRVMAPFLSDLASIVPQERVAELGAG